MDVVTQQRIQQVERTLSSMGDKVHINLSLNDKRQWYRADGTPLPHLLPVDDYNRAVFEANGWSLIPPAGAPVIKEKTLSPIEAEVAKSIAAAEAETTAAALSPILQANARETENLASKRKSPPVVIPPFGMDSMPTGAAPLYISNKDREAMEAKEQE